MQTQKLPNTSTDEVIHELQKTRDSFISKLLTDNGLNNFLEGQYEVVALSPVKIEFLKRDLKELQRSSLDLAHYSSLIKLAKETGDTAQGSHLFLSELHTIFQKYIVK